MATLRQRKLAKAKVANAAAGSPLNKKELLVSIGYSELTANKEAKTILEAKGVQEETEKLGIKEAFPDEELFTLHREGLYDQDLNTRWKYLHGAYELKGSYAPDKHINLNINKDESNHIEQLAKKVGDELEKEMLNDTSGTA